MTYQWDNNKPTAQMLGRWQPFHEGHYTLFKEIINLKNNAPEKINKIAIETTNDLIKQLIGMEVNNSSISAIVEDLSKKNKGKYYGI